MSGRLLIDLGSRGMAWRGVGKPGATAHTGEPGECLARAFNSLSRPDEVVLGSVAAEPVTRKLRAWCRENWDREPREFAASAQACGVRNAYAHPAQLGIDRWAALVAAHKQYDGAVLIADCGTAVTADYMESDGRHIGGVIAPGLGLMREALPKVTRLAPVSRHAPTPRLLGTDTELGVTGGALAATVGMIRYVSEKTAARHGPPAAMLITGGDAQTVLPRLDSRWQAAPDLVLDGLEWLAGEAE